jgi:hypothetical protein
VSWDVGDALYTELLIRPFLYFIIAGVCFIALLKQYFDGGEA